MNFNNFPFKKIFINFSHLDSPVDFMQPRDTKLKDNTLKISWQLWIILFELLQMSPNGQIKNA